MKKFLLSFLFVFSLLFTFSVSSKLVNATQSDNGKGNWTPEETITSNVLGMEHLSVYGTANGTNPQHINVLSMNTDGYSSKLVTWSVTSGNNKYTRQTLDEIARDYERTHPGWIVVGGINGDQYSTGFGSDLAAGSAYFTPQTYYPLIMDNESRIPYTVMNSYANHVGFANNGSANSLVGASPVKGYVLTVVDDNKEEIAKFTVDCINESPTGDEIAVWSTYISKANMSTYITREINSTNPVYVVTNPELAYMSNCVEYGGVNSLFGKGQISEIVNEVILVKNQFAIETSDPEVAAALEVGANVIVDAEYEDEALNQVEASTGYHSVHRYNDEDQALVHTDYDGNRYSRAIIGRKADGTYVLLTVDVATDPNDFSIRYAGMGFDECNATLKHYGVVEAYQMDGGGSVTSILRNKEGGFDISNYTREGVRANMTGLLFVVRDPSVSATSTHHSIVLEHQDIYNAQGTVQNIKAVVDGKEYAFGSKKSIEITGLEENKEYDVTIKYDVVSNNNDVASYELVKSVQTKTYEGEQPQFEIVNLGKSSFSLLLNNFEKFSNIQVEVNNSEYAMNNSKLDIADLIGDTTYNIDISYNVYDEVSQNSYPRTHTMTVTTLNFEIPVISAFEIARTTDSRITLKYGYEDVDGIVTRAYVLVNEEVHELTSKSGLLNISDLDLTSNIYNMEMVVEFEVEGATQVLKSVKLSAGSESEVVMYDITYDLDGGVCHSLIHSYEYGVGLQNLPVPTKEGYVFAGWSFEGVVVDSIAGTMTGEIHLVAVWSEITTVPGSGCQMGAAIQHLVTLSTVLGFMVVLLKKRK